MIGQISEVLLRQVPSDLLAGVNTGQYQVLGSIIRSVSSGRIVGHLQETSSLLNIVASAPLAPAQLAVGAVNMVEGGIAIYQNEQIKAALAVMKSLQIANLALSGISIGVSIAGTAVLAKRISRVEEKVDKLLPSIEAVATGVRELQAEQVSKLFTDLRRLAEQVGEAWLPSATNNEWVDIARESHELASHFEDRALRLDAASGELMAERFVDAYALASNMRITARLAAGQDDMARQAASSSAETLAALGAPIRRRYLAQLSAPVELAGTLEWQEQVDKQVDSQRPLIAEAREREFAAAASAETLEELARQEISGRAWLEASRAEEQSPLLFLAASG